MTTIPGIAVGLLGLLGVLVAFGLIQLTRYWLRPMLYAFAAILRIIPVVGGLLSREVLKFERIVDSWLASAAVHTERLAVGFFHGLTALVGRLGEEIAGLAADTYKALSSFARVTVPRLIRAAVADLLRLVRAAEARILAVERRVVALAGAVERQLVALERRVQATVQAAVLQAERFALRELRAGLGLLTAALHTLERAMRAAEYRIGRVEYEIVSGIRPELAHLARTLNPLTVGEWAAAHLWALVPHGLQTFFRWVWHLLTGFEGWLVDVAEGRWPPPADHHTGRRYVQQTARDAEGLAEALRRELGI